MIFSSCCLAILASNQATATQAKAPREPNELSEIFSPAKTATLRKLGFPWDRRADHFFSASPPVKRNEIPDKVIEPCEMWLRKILKPEFIPANLISLWHGIRMAPDRDLLVANFTVKQYAMTWVDSQGQIALIVRDTSAVTPADTEEDIKDLARAVPRTFLKMPPGWENFFKVSAYPALPDRGSLWHGYAADVRAFDPRKNPPEKDNWFLDFEYFTDGATVYFEMRAVEDGKWLGWDYGASHYRLPGRS